jgi:hypothetical protein
MSPAQTNADDERIFPNGAWTFSAFGDMIRSEWTAGTGPEGDAVAIIKTIPKVALILIFMPILLFGIVLWMPIRKLMN